MPEISTGPRGTLPEVLEAVRNAGFAAYQGSNAQAILDAGLVPSAGGRVNAIGEAAPQARRLRDEGFVCATLHVGWGIEDDDFIDALVQDIHAASESERFPLYIETHRATITEDIWRTVKLIERNPDVRINGDFSHYYTGHEMVYGDFEQKLDFLSPVFDRVRYMHGRISSPGCMQVPIKSADDDSSYVTHFREFWTRSMLGFLRTAKPGDYITFVPELLGPTNFYARTFPDAAGNLVEESDRWQQALLYVQIAKECFEEALRRHKYIVVVESTYHTRPLE